MGKKKSWVQLFLVWIMLFQYGSSAIYAVAMEENQSLNQTMHVIKVSEEKNSDRRQVETLIEESGIEKDSYTIQEPIALFSVTQEGLTEEHYYPVLSQKN
ncbi:hypothetical protein IGL98_002265 [Enterococcus sp. DIV0840]|nr:hypothetical protein [Enterococcus sp. DIV0849a]MBO0433310.1 hypothetical protein [Enterococcus sp. DIV0849a]